MERPMILVSSITYALKGRDLLLSYRISSFVERIPHLSKQTGCGYALYVPKETDEAETILKEAGIKVLGREQRASTV